MLKNHNHDLIHQLSETSDSLWRLDEYIKNSNSCSYCEALWSKIKQDHENHVALITEEIKRHISEGRFD